MKVVKDIGVLRWVRGPDAVADLSGAGRELSAVGPGRSLDPANR